MLSTAQGHHRTYLYGLFRTNYKKLKLRCLLSSSVLTWWDWKVCNRAKYLNLKLKREKCIAETRCSETNAREKREVYQSKIQTPESTEETSLWKSGIQKPKSKENIKECSRAKYSRWNFQTREMYMLTDVGCDPDTRKIIRLICEKTE